TGRHRRACHAQAHSPVRSAAAPSASVGVLENGGGVVPRRTTSARGRAVLALSGGIADGENCLGAPPGACEEAVRDGGHVEAAHGTDGKTSGAQAHDEVAKLNPRVRGGGGDTTLRCGLKLLLKPDNGGRGDVGQAVVVAVRR